MGIKFFSGNVKVGDMLTFNKLAGSTEFHGCKGSCGEHCSGCWSKSNWQKSPCYVAKSYVQYGEAVLKPHIENTLAMRKDPLGSVKELDKQLSRKRTNKTVRIHSSGELESAKELEAWIWLARKHQERQFYIYTKNFEVVDEVLEKAKTLPPNFFINISIWHELGIDCYNKWKDRDGVRAFVYDDGTFDYSGNGLSVTGVCPAYRKDSKGKVKLYHDLTCDKCQMCFKNTNKVVKCLNH